MKNILGILLILGGIVLGLYLGLWVFFIGGIAGLINIIVGITKGNEIQGMAIAIDIAKIVFAGFIGWLSAAILIIPGQLMLNNK